MHFFMLNSLVLVLGLNSMICQRNSTFTTVCCTQKSAFHRLDLLQYMHLNAPTLLPIISSSLEPRIFRFYMFKIRGAQELNLKMGGIIAKKLDGDAHKIRSLYAACREQAKIRQVAHLHPMIEPRHCHRHRLTKLHHLFFLDLACPK